MVRRLGHSNSWNIETRVFNDKEDSDFRRQHSNYAFALAFAGRYCLTVLKQLNLDFPSFSFLPADAAVASKIYMIEGHLCK